jgi:FkbM family methyltransferase
VASREILGESALAEARPAGLTRRAFRRLVSCLPRGRARVARALSTVIREPFIDIVEPHDQGVELLIDPTDPFQLEIWLGAYQPHVVSFLRRSVRPGAIVLCAGLHVGYIAALARTFAGLGGYVLSAEPDPVARKRASRNLARQNGVARFTVFEGGLSDQHGTRTLYRSSVLGHSSFAGEHQPVDEQAVPVVPGDGWLSEIGVTALDAMVLDVEGWELHVLRGLHETLTRSRSLVALVEVTEWALRDAGTSSADLFAFLWDLGFQVRWVTEYGEHIPFGAWGPLVGDAREARSNDVLCIRP